MSTPTPLLSITNSASLSDPFLTLPTELVGWIFEIVDNDNEIPVTSNALGLVSRTFLPFVRRKAFETVHIWSSRQFRQFLDCSKECPSVLSYVEILVIHIQSEPDDTEFDEQLPKLLQNLTSVIQIEIVNYKRLMDLVLNVPSLSPTLPSLRALRLKYDDTHDADNYLEPRYWTKLHRYPELWSLHLQFPSEFTRYNADTTLTKDLEIQELTLIAPFTMNAAIVDFLDHFRSLTSLHLRAFRSNFYDKPVYPLSPVLRSMKHPKQIQTLTLDLDSFKPEYASILPRFSKVESLHLKQGNCDKEKLETIQSSFKKLKRLAFDFTSQVSTDDLGALLAKDNSNRPPQLSVVILNTARPVNVRDLLMKGCCIDESDGELSILPGVVWSYQGGNAGSWGDRVTMAGVRKVMRMGEEVGVDLRGNDVETVKEVREIFKEDPSYWTTRAKS